MQFQDLPTIPSNAALPIQSQLAADCASVIEARIWHETIYEDTLYLLSMINTFRDDMPEEIVDMGLNSLNEIEQRLSTIDCPDCAHLVRWHLLNAISDMDQALKNTQAEKEKSANAYNYAAKIEMGFFDIELLRLGLS